MNIRSAGLTWFVALSILLMSGCVSATDDSPTATESVASLLTLPPTVQPITFPDDEAPHDGMTEWWYYTGHLFDDQQDRYGFEFVVFQVRRDGFPTYYASHFAITDNQRRSFNFDQRTGFNSSLFIDQGFNLRVGGWEMQGNEGTDLLRASMAKYAIDLELTTDQDPVLHNNGTGYMEIGSSGGSYYYSRPDMNVSGTLTVEGEPLAVTGSAWMDHQWGDFELIEGGGWDWFSAQLDDGTNLMVFQLRGTEQVDNIADFGTLVQPDGQIIHLTENEFTIDELQTWTSPDSGAVYPIDWTIAIPDHNLLLELHPTIEAQELDTTASTGTIYWEGEVEVSAQRSGEPLTGLGYVELTGYAESDLLSP